MYDKKEIKKTNDAQTDRAQGRAENIGTARQGAFLGNGKKGLGKSRKSTKVQQQSRESRGYKASYGVKIAPLIYIVPSGTT